MKFSTIIVLLFVLLPPLLSAIMNQLAKAKQKRMLDEQRRERVRSAGITLEPAVARTPPPPPPAADSLAEQRRRQIERLRQRRAEQLGSHAAQPPPARMPVGGTDSGRTFADASRARMAAPPPTRVFQPAPVAESEPVRRTVPSRQPSPKPQRRDQKRVKAGEETSGRLRTAAADPRRQAEAQRGQKDRLAAEVAMRLHSRPAVPREAPGTGARDRIARLLIRPGRDPDLRQLIIAKELLDAPLSLRPGF
jgi:hypothetical protein